MPKSTAIEYDKRIRAVMEWVLEDWPDCDIRQQLMVKYSISESQAKKDLAVAIERWKKESDKDLYARRARRIQSLKRTKRQLEHKYKGTPYGMQVILQYEREIARLEGIEYTKEELEAERRAALPETADPLAPDGGVLKIQILPPYEPAPPFPSPDQKPT